MRGVILAGGSGTRLRPLTQVMNKHLLPVYNKPMILYPIETLKSFGVVDILLITGGGHLGSFVDFLGDGSDYGIRLAYKIQKEAGGIAQALGLAEDFVGDDKMMVILGDNIFEPLDTRTAGKADAHLWVKRVPDANRFGVLKVEKRPHHIVEKPKDTGEGLAVTGLYLYPPDVFQVIKTLKPSKRGELEITDVNNHYLSNNRCAVSQVETFWSDAGTPDSLLAASNFISGKR